MGPSSRLIITLLSSSLVAAAPAPHAPVHQRREDDTTTGVTFADVVPSTKLQWVDCYQPKFQCTYLTVPLDYSNTQAGTIDVAFIRYLLNETAEDLMYNPGGPGESGVTSLQDWGPSFAKKWGYNPVSFDPRGVHWTGPDLSCPEANTALSRRQDDALEYLTKQWQDTVPSNEACTVANENTNAKYVGTSAVVQDMIYFTKLQAAARGKDPEKALINYYGVSYGTLVGQTLVAMYPDRLRRVVLDANVYGVAHYQGWEPSGYDDWGHAIYLFAKLCSEAGEEWCPLAAGNKSVEQVKHSFDTVVRSLNMTSRDLFLGQISGFLYSPNSETSGYTAIVNATLGGIAYLDGKKLTKRDDETWPKERKGTALGMITGVDIAGRYPWKTFEQWKAAMEQVERTNAYGATLYTSNGLIGAGFGIIPPPSQFFPGFKAITPRVPVLFVNTLGDPVTPVTSVHNMKRYFAGSGAVFVDGPGHGYSSAPSKCAINAVAKYFADGVVPEKDLLCQTDVPAEYYFGAPGEEWTRD